MNLGVLNLVFPTSSLVPFFVLVKVNDHIGEGEVLGVGFVWGSATRGFVVLTFDVTQSARSREVDLEFGRYLIWYVSNTVVPAWRKTPIVSIYANDKLVRLRARGAQGDLKLSPEEHL